jgi:RNA polymerase primary sigma factor
MKTFDEDVRVYIQEAGKYPVLSREEEVELFKKLENGNDFVFDEIVKHNLRFVIKIALKYKGRGLPLSDIIQEGNIGLLEVVSKYDYRKGFRFSTYAAFWIKQAIQVALRKNGSIIALPVRKARLVARLSETTASFVKKHGFEPSVSDLARIMKITEKVVKETRKLRESVLSLDGCTEDENISLIERVPDRKAQSPLEYCMANQLRIKIAGLLKMLSEKEQRIMRIRFGFEHGKNMSLRKTSRLVGLSQEGVRRIERKALAKLSRPSLKSKFAALV